MMLVRMLMEVMAAALGAVAFDAIFGVPKEYYKLGGVIGGAGWLIYFIFWKQLHLLSEPSCVFLSTVLVILLSRLCAVYKRCPVTIFLVSGILPLVPGAGIYWTSFYLVTNQLPEAIQSGFTAVKDAVAIVLGIVFVFELPQSLFRKAVKK